MTAALPLIGSGEQTLPLEPTCATVRAEKYNDGLQIRRQITGNEQKFRHRPVCKALYGRLRDSVHRARGKCKGDSTTDLASWFSPEPTASGMAYGDGTVGVAHKTLPFGTVRWFRHAGRTRSAPVIDRGPYIAGRVWDLTAQLAQDISFDGVGSVTVSAHNCWAAWR
jgi:rare lipoprotein A (peptidoglycan hydrolase)